MGLTKTFNKYKYEILTILILIIVVFFIYPKVSPYISHNLKVESVNLKVDGYYYSLNMDQLTNLTIESNNVIQTGFDVMLYEPSEEYNIVRDIPSEYLPLLGIDTSWVLLNRSESKDNYTIRVFENSRTKNKIKVYLPFWNSDPEWYVFRLNNNRVLFILSSANFKRGEDVYLAYILIS